MTTSSAPAPPVYVIGHRNPDTDAICSAIGYADFLRRTTRPEAVAACCGEINDRTAWVLTQAGVSAPRLLMDVRSTAESICQKNVATARSEDTFLTVYTRMAQSGFRSLPVVDEMGKVLGMPTYLELLQLLLPGSEVRREARFVRASIRNVTQVLDGELVNEPDGSQEEDLLLVVGASTEQTIRARAQDLPVERIMMIVGDRPEVQTLAIEGGVRCLVLTGGCALSPLLATAAEERNIPVISCRQDTASASQLIRCSRTIAEALTGEFLSFHTHTLVEHIVDAIKETSQPLFPVVDADTGKLVGVFSKSDLIEPPEVRLVLVDHNEFSQAVTGAAEAEILEVIDHHRLSGNLVSKEPVRFVNEPLGSTSTIVSRFYQQAGIAPDKGVATCLAAGIIADTLTLTSPTTTDVDREILPWLAGIAEIDVDEFTRGFFETGSVLRTQSPSDAVGADRKEFSENGWKISISQIEELGLDVFSQRESDLHAALDAVRRESGLDFACLMVTDITKHYSLLLTAGSEEITEEIGYPELHRNLFEMDGVVSRKKQLFPHLGRILGRLAKP